MAARSILAAVEPLRARPPREATAPLMGALGGALSGFALTGEPVGACIGRCVGFLRSGRESTQLSEIRP